MSKRPSNGPSANQDEAPPAPTPDAPPAPAQLPADEAPPPLPADAPSAPSTKPPPIVCVGASAGGLEALVELLSPLSPDVGVALVIITHQHPGHTSLLPELLARTTRLPVLAAAAGLRLEPNHVYVGMPDGRLEIADSRLRHAPAAVEPGSHRPIDHFLRCLAADQGEGAIAVILSGAGDDGALGIKAIKAAGGLIMVQEPSTAKYDSMPASAIATGLADYVLAPGDMADALRKYVQEPYLQGGHPHTLAAGLLPEVDTTRILLRLREKSGHDFTGYKRSTISRRIERRMSVHHLKEPGAYLDLLRDSSQEARLLMQELLISVTGFFRDPEAFQALAEKTLPALLESHAPDLPLRVWVAGCATGEEAYSTAIVLREQLQDLPGAPHIQIFGTDLDGHAIDVARAGRYPEAIVADVTAERLERFFVHEDGGYRVCREIREDIVFALHDLLRDPPFTRLDLIVCRNLLIYLTAEVQRRLLPALHYALQPGGLLFLGSSETIGEAGTLFETVDAKWKIHRRRKTVPAIPPLMGPGDRRWTPVVSPSLPIAKASQANVALAVQQMMLDRFTPPSLVVDRQGNIVYVQGRTGMYLEPADGHPSNNILQMAREGLGPALATALRQAQLGSNEIVRSNVRVRTNHEFGRVDVAVMPIEEPAALCGMFLVTFKPSVVAEAQMPQVKPGDEDLAAELRDTRQSLQATIEDLATANGELRTSNEELQSTNEELQSTNEELETTKEELQSLNEEMNTVNAELRSKMEALALASDDLKNLLNSTEVACIFLDEELKVKRYTEQAKDLIRLIESDVGRPLADLTTSLVYDRLAEDCRKVLDTLVAREVEIRDKEGHWWLLRILPYRTEVNVIEGVVVTLVNIDRVMRAELAQTESAASRDLFECIVQAVRGPLVVLDPACRVVLANDSFHRLFGTRPADTDRHSLFDLANRIWDVPQLREQLAKVLSDGLAITDFEIELDLPGLGRRNFVLNARRAVRKPGLPTMVLLAMEEVSGQ